MLDVVSSIPASGAAPVGPLLASPTRAVAFTPSYCERLSQRVAEYAIAQIERLADKFFQGWRIPGTFAGHPVGSDVRADIAFTLALLHDLGVDRTAGTDLPQAIASVLRPIDGRRTNTFWSCRVAEALHRFGPFVGNPLMDGWSRVERENLALACDSSESLDQLHANKLPRNYAAVLARCEWALTKLQLQPEDSPRLKALIDQTRDLMSVREGGYLDDSDTGCGRYDIYTADLYLFSEPFADRLAPVWERGARSAVNLVEKTVMRNGAAFSWGRSTGALAVCMTMELGALALEQGLTADTGRWQTLVTTAFENIPGWFADNGLISAHQRRSTYRYRGLHRLIQMTFDCLGKLLWTSLALRRASRELLAQPIPREAAFPAEDTMLCFDEAQKAGVWCYRGKSTSFVLPITGATINDYLPAPSNPGLFETPVESELPSGVPFAFFNDKRFVAGYLPLEVEKSEAGLRLRYQSYPQAGQWNVGRSTPALGGSRNVQYRVEGRSVFVEEQLRFDRAPSAVGMQIAEAFRRPVAVRLECSSAHSSSILDTAGMKDFRSFWGEIPRIHQFDFEPSEELRFSYRVTPALRVLSANHRHHYHRSIYDCLAGRVVDGTTMPACHDLRNLSSTYRHWDVFHLHWPEALGSDAVHHREIIADLAAAGVPIVWTQHNLVPHTKDERFTPIYQDWAAAATGVIHHSEWGRVQSLQRYRFNPRALHRVIPHPHFNEMKIIDPGGGEVAGRRLRLGLFGAPRVEKRVDMTIRAFNRCERGDLELLVYSLSANDPIPRDPRIVAHRYEFVPRDVYDSRLRGIDLLILPFDRTGMLTTGAVADAVAHGIPALISDWPFLTEALGDAGISYGQTEDDLLRALNRLDLGTIARARQACTELRGRYSPQRIAELTFDLLEAVVAGSEETAAD